MERIEAAWSRQPISGPRYRVRIPASQPHCHPRDKTLSCRKLDNFRTALEGRRLVTTACLRSSTSSP